MDQIGRAAIAMAGGLGLWNGMSGEIRDEFRELARRAAEVLVKAVPWEEIEVTLGVALTEHSGNLTNRRADSDTRRRIVQSQVKKLKLSRYTVVCAPQAWGLAPQCRLNRHRHDRAEIDAAISDDRIAGASGPETTTRFAVVRGKPHYRVGRNVGRH